MANDPGSSKDPSVGRPSWTVVVPQDLTGGTFEILEETRGSIGGPPRHVHRDRDEGFYVLHGRYRFERGDEGLEVGPGQFVWVPKGTQHTFRTLDAGSRTLIIVAPAGLAGFFAGLTERLAAGESALESMRSLSATYDTHPVD